MIAAMKLLLIGAALLAILLVAGCGGSKATPTPTLTPTPGPTATPTAGAATPTVQDTTEAPTTPEASPSLEALELTLDLASGRVERGEEFTIVVNLDPVGRGISGVQIKIEYDSAIFKAVGAEPGDLLGSGPAEAGPMFDQAKGSFDYAAARIGPTEAPTSPGRFAIFKFQTLESAPAGAMTAIRITEAKIPDENIRPISEISIGPALELQISP